MNTYVPEKESVKPRKYNPPITHPRWNMSSHYQRNTGFNSSYLGDPQKPYSGPENTTRWTNIGLLLAHGLQCRHNINILTQRPVFAG